MHQHKLGSSCVTNFWIGSALKGTNSEKPRRPQNVCQQNLASPLTEGFLYGAGAETLIFVTGTSGKYLKIFVSQQKNKSQLWIPGKPRKIGVWVSGAEIQTSAVDTRTAVWVSTAEKFSKIFLGETRNFSRKFRGVSAPALYKNPAVAPPPPLEKQYKISRSLIFWVNDFGEVWAFLTNLSLLRKICSSLQTSALPACFVYTQGSFLRMAGLHF